MRARTQMTNAITHLNDQERYISKDYKDVRIKELQQFVAPCRIGVAKAIQYLVIFNKHNDEEWRFLRKGFLKKHAKSLAESLEESCNNWRDFIVEKYGVAEVTKEAYVRHLESQNKLATDALVETEAKSFKEKKNIQLEKEMGELLKNLKKVNNPTAIAEKDLYQLRVLMSAVEDIEEFKKLDDDDDDDDDDEQIAALHEVKKFLEKNVSQEDLENDENIWPHQQGLQDLGPFKSVVLYKADLYLNVDLDANKYSLQKEAHGIDGFANEKSNCDMTTLQEVSIPARDRKLINIPPNAEYYAWLFPAEGINDAETVMGHALDNSPLHVVFQFGGFAYFDKEKKLLTANGVTFGDDLFFDGPYYIPNEEVYSSIESKGIPMKDITIPELRDLDARRFAWLHPSDQDTLGLESEDGSKLPSDYWGFSGAFVYEYEQKEGMEKRRNYFQLLDFKEVGLKKTKNTNTPIVSTLRTFWEKYHEEWSETRKAGDEAPMELLFSSRW